MPRAKRWRVLKDFDFSPRPNIVQVFRAGEERSGLTRACIQKGRAIKALEQIKKKETD